MHLISYSFDFPNFHQPTRKNHSIQNEFNFENCMALYTNTHPCIGRALKITQQDILHIYIGLNMLALNSNRQIAFVRGSEMY